MDGTISRDQTDVCREPDAAFASIPILDLSLADDQMTRPLLLSQLHDALFNVGFLYLVSHGVQQRTIDNLTSLLPRLFNLSSEAKSELSKINSPHFLGYSGFAEETTLGKQDLREQFDFATELPVIWQSAEKTNGRCSGSRDFSAPYWRLRGPNQFPPEELIPGFRQAYTEYHDEVANLASRLVHLIEESFALPAGTFDRFFQVQGDKTDASQGYLPPQHRIKLLKYPKSDLDGQGVGPHKDSSGWLTLLYQLGPGLEVQNGNGDFIAAPPIEGSFVVNFGNALEAATEGAVRATVHRVKATAPSSSTRYSIPFFQGLPLDLTVSEIRSYIPAHVRALRRTDGNAKGIQVSSFLDPRWDNLGESQLRKWLRSHEATGRKFYGDELVEYYLQA